jgi:hypothetical protein
LCQDAIRSSALYLAQQQQVLGFQKEQTAHLAAVAQLQEQLTVANETLKIDREVEITKNTHVVNN